MQAARAPTPFANRCLPFSDFRLLTSDLLPVPPTLSPASLAAALRAGYGLSAAAITCLPLGLDYAAAVYRVTAADGHDYFLKGRTNAVHAAGLAVPAYLRAQGLAQVLAPLPTLSGALWHSHDGQTLVLYPFLPAAVPLPSGTADEHWRQFGAALRQVHTSALPPEVAALLPRETFTPVAVEQVNHLDALITASTFDQPLQRDFAAGWRAHAAQIHAVAERATVLGQRLRAAPPAALCLCHADPHWDNVLVDAHAQLWLVDWDDTLLAVPECDLMFVIGGISAGWATPRDTALFFEGYGPAAVDPLALAYYRANWAVQDLASFAEQVLITPNVSEADERDALRLFLSLFEAGSIVATALASDPAHA
jgi:spectinomycin phosphotransferase